MLNKAILMGRLTRDPELRHTQSNMAVCSFSLAIDRERTRRTTARAHSAANAHVHVVNDVPTQALGCRELLLRIANRDRLLDHRTQGRLGKCQ